MMRREWRLAGERAEAALRSAMGGISPWPLVVLTIVVTALAAAGILPRWPGLPHLVALPPLDLMSDLRILLARAPGYPEFFAGLALSLVVRIGVLALMLGGLRRPRLRLAAAFYAVALPPSALVAGFTYASPATLFYLFFWVGLVLAVLFITLLAAIPRMGRTSLADAARVSARQSFRAGTVFAYLGLVTVVGGVADAGGGAAAVLVTPISAILTLAAIRFLAADPGLRLACRTLAAGTGAAIAAMATILLTGPGEPPPGDPPETGRQGSLLIMSGVDSRSGRGVIFETNPHRIGFTCEQTYYYSYAGPGDGAPQRDATCPIRTGAIYTPHDTLRASEELMQFFFEQIEGLPEPVVVKAHSQAVWIVWMALLEGDARNVGTVVLVGTFTSSPAGYPLDGQPGPGRAGGGFLRLITELPRPGGTAAFEMDAPLAREFLAEADAVGTLLAFPPPQGVQVLSFPSVSDLPLMPSGWEIPGVVSACPMRLIHPHLPWAEEYHDIIDAFLDGEPPPALPSLGPPDRTADPAIHGAAGRFVASGTAGSGSGRES